MNDTNRFLNLPIEIIRIILQEVDAADRDSLRSACRTLRCSLTPGDQLHLSGYSASPTMMSRFLDRSDINYLDHFLKVLLMNRTIANKVVSANMNLIVYVDYSRDAKKCLPEVVHSLSRLPNLRKLVATRELLDNAHHLERGAFKKLELLYINKRVDVSLQGFGFPISARPTNPIPLHEDLWTSYFPALSWLCFDDGLLCLKNVDRSTLKIDVDETNELVIRDNPAGDLFECYSDKEDYRNHMDQLFRASFPYITKQPGDLAFFLEESNIRLFYEGKPCVFDFADTSGALKFPPDYYRGVWPSQQREVLVSSEESHEPLRPPAVLEASSTSVSAQTRRSLRPRTSSAKYKEDSDEDGDFDAAGEDADSDYDGDRNGLTTCRYCSVHYQKRASR